MRSLKIIEDLYLTNRVFCSFEYDRCVDYLCDVLPFTRRRYTESSKAAEHGWEIHPKWDVEEAWIKKDGNVIWDGTQHPLAVMALSAPFRGKVARAIHYRSIYIRWAPTTSIQTPSPSSFASNTARERATGDSACRARCTTAWTPARTMCLSRRKSPRDTSACLSTRIRGNTTRCSCSSRIGPSRDGKRRSVRRSRRRRAV